MPRETFRKIITSEEKIEKIEQSNKELVDRFLRYMKPRSSDGTIKVYRSNYNIFFCWNLEHNGNKPFEQIKKIEMQDFFLFCSEDLKFNSNRYAQMHSSLSSLSNYIENQLDEIDRYKDFRNIVKKIEKLPKEPVRKKTILSVETVDKLMLDLEKEGRLQEAVFIALAVSCGARISELFRITLDLIDENETAFDGLFLITKEPIRTKGRGQNGKQLHKYIIKDLFLPWLKKWEKQRKTILKNNGVEEHNCIFVKQNGEPATQSTVRNWIARWETMTGLNIYPHSFRHYFVTYLSKVGLEAELIQSIVGWSSSDMVAIYNDLRIDEREWKGLGKLASALNSTKTKKKK